MSIFLGSQLEDVIAQLEQGAASTSKQGGHVELGVTSLPVLPKDATDRNRTSPFAFTGNKFEFRAVGSSAPIYWPQTVLNTAVADSLSQLADELEKLEPGDFDGLTDDPVARSSRTTSRSCSRATATPRSGMPRPPAAGCPTTGPPSMRCRRFTTDKAMALFSGFGVLSERELTARAEIHWERYVKVQNIEAPCALDIAKTMILPAAVTYLGRLAAAGSSQRRRARRGGRRRADRRARGRDPRPRARPARGPRGRFRPGGGARLRATR